MKLQHILYFSQNTGELLFMGNQLSSNALTVDLFIQLFYSILLSPMRWHSPSGWDPVTLSPAINCECSLCKITKFFSFLLGVLFKFISGFDDIWSEDPIILIFFSPFHQCDMVWDWFFTIILFITNK